MLKLPTPLLAMSLRVRAETAPGFPFQVSTHPKTCFDWSQHFIDATEDRQLSETDCRYAPAMYKPGNEHGNEAYLVIMVDQDVSYQRHKVELLQWLRPNLPGTHRELLADATAQNATHNLGAFYYPPAPTGGSSPHYYTLVLYQQSENWNVRGNYASFCPPAYVMATAPFNITDFADASGLGDPVAANYFWVQNRTHTYRKQACNILERRYSVARTLCCRACRGYSVDL